MKYLKLFENVTRKDWRKGDKVLVYSSLMDGEEGTIIGFERLGNKTVVVDIEGKEYRTSINNIYPRISIDPWDEEDWNESEDIYLYKLYVDRDCNVSVKFEKEYRTTMLNSSLFGLHFTNDNSIRKIYNEFFRYMTNLFFKEYKKGEKLEKINNDIKKALDVINIKLKELEDGEVIVTGFFSEPYFYSGKLKHVRNDRWGMIRKGGISNTMSNDEHERLFRTGMVTKGRIIYISKNTKEIIRMINGTYNERIRWNTLAKKESEKNFNKLMKLRDNYGYLQVLHLLNENGIKLLNINESNTFGVKDYVEKKHGNQKYGEHSYMYHINNVKKVCDKFINKYNWTKKEKRIIEISVLCHDLLEDTDLEYRDIYTRFGKGVANTVYNLTGVGKNRRERNLHAYNKIKDDKISTFVKLCDRISNTEESLKNKNKYRMYKIEYPMFRRYLRRLGEFEEMWEYLGKLNKKG